MATRNGFTLVEMLVVVVIMAVVLIGISYSVGYFQTSATKGISQAMFHSETQARFEELCREMTKGSAFIIESSGRKLTITLPDRTSVFTLQNGVLYRNNGTGAFEFQTNVDDVQFYAEKQDTLLQITLEVDYDGKQEKLERKVFLKNHP